MRLLGPGGRGLKVEIFGWIETCSSVWMKPVGREEGSDDSTRGEGHKGTPRKHSSRPSRADWWQLG